MRVSAGKFKGREIHRPKTTQTRPMSDKVRAALFNILGPVGGFRVLDAYAGSGAIGFEALSHGAASVTGVESSRTTATCIQKTIQDFGLVGDYQLIIDTVEHLGSRLQNLEFDLIVADPPYDQINAQTLDNLTRYLSADGVMVISHTSRITPPELKSVELVDSRKYGDSTLSFYKK